MLSSVQKSRLLFLTLCLPLRLAIVYAAASQPSLRVPLAVLMAVLAIGITFIYLTGSRQTGTETFGEPIWWNNLRPIHGALWALSSLLLFQNSPLAPYVLGADVAIGFGAFYSHHFAQ